jgi:hypothetical protein
MRGLSWLAAKPVSFSRRTLLHGVRLIQLQLLNVWENWCHVVRISEAESIYIDWLRNISRHSCLWSVCWFYHWTNCRTEERSPKACDDVYCLVIYPTQHFQTLPIPRATSILDTHDSLPTISFIFNIHNFSEIGWLSYWYIWHARLLRYCSSEPYFIYMTSKILPVWAIFHMRNFWVFPTLWDIYLICVTSEVLPTVWYIFHMHDFLNTAHCLSYVLYRPHTAFG